MKPFLTSEVLEACYEFLKVTGPFRDWNLPDGEDVKFVVDRHHSTAGWYLCDGGKHTIGISSKCVGHTVTLIQVMAHEMIHLFQRDSSMETKGAEHNAAFKKLAHKVCAVHGFDPKMF